MKTQKIIDHIVNWLSEYVHSTGVKGFVVGVSGGIDSAVTSTLCAKTGLPTLCLEMPIHQPKTHLYRSSTHIQNLMSNYQNVSCENVDLTRPFEQFKVAVSLDGESSTVDLALANTRARLRMSALYFYAGKLGRLVVGTGNKVEDFGIGFFTKYGDGGVDISPIADLLKTEVYLLGETLGVAESIMNAPPTDGLFEDDRSDEQQIGATYSEIEWAMKQYEKGKIVTDFEGREREVLERYAQLHRQNIHKMNPIPICVIPKDFK